MSMKLDAGLEKSGTRFRIFPLPRFLKNSEPEVVIVSVSPDEIQSGPADNRMFVADAINKQPYNNYTNPPYKGEIRPPVKAGKDGYFDKINLDSRDFSAATMYATVRRVLDIWEDYFGGYIAWHFQSDFERLELIPLIEWDNAQSGYGFLEFGYGSKPSGGIDHKRPYCENFDVLAHELGHSIIFSKVGTPANPKDKALDYGGMHESAGDLVALIALLHFNSVVDRLLSKTKGNLFTVNELDRLGELSDSDQIRLAFNNLRMSDVGNEEHDRSEPLTGAIFDVLVEVFQKNLVEAGLISQELATKSTQNPTNAGQDLKKIQREFDLAYSRKGSAKEFKTALLNARDYAGKLLAHTWGNLDPNFMTYHDILVGLLNADKTISNGKHQNTIRECFAWREIKPSSTSHLLRTFSLKSCGLTK